MTPEFIFQNAWTNEYMAFYTAVLKQPYGTQLGCFKVEIHVDLTDIPCGHGTLFLWAPNKTGWVEIHTTPGQALKARPEQFNNELSADIEVFLEDVLALLKIGIKILI